jgi:hypothetical protein
MKIQGSMPAPVRESVQGRARASVESRRESVAKQVLLTTGARFVDSTRAAATSLESIRADEVAKARADLMSGALLNEAELDAAVDAILAGL